MKVSAESEACLSSLVVEKHNSAGMHGAWRRSRSTLCRAFNFGRTVADFFSLLSFFSFFSFSLLFFSFFSFFFLFFYTQPATPPRSLRDFPFFRRFARSRFQLLCPMIATVRVASAIVNRSHCRAHLIPIQRLTRITVATFTSRVIKKEKQRKQGKRKRRNQKYSLPSG